MRTQLFIHHNLLQHKTLVLFIWLSYHDTTTLHDNLIISYLTPLMPWCGNMGGEHPYLYDSMGHMVLPCAHLLHTFYKISNSRIFLVLI